jgi:DNA-binding response OmpR family regulator
VRLLLVEDSQRLQRALCAGLRKSGYALDIAVDGPTGLALARAGDYDVIILDLMLPGLDGLSVLKRLREEGGDAHVMILTARDSLEERVRGLQAGADDFLVKPFAFAELVARLQALVRRRHGRKNPLIAVGPLLIDSVAQQVTRDGAQVALSPREYALLHYLALRQGEVVTRADVEAHLYDGRTELASNAVDSAVCALRRRIDPAGSPSLIETRRGQGYVLRKPSV